ncbi:MFS transporter [Spongorhabdus nitratireducens]
MSAIFVDIMSFGLVTPMIVAAFAEDIFLAASPDTVRDLAQAIAFAIFPLGMFLGAAVLGDLSDHWGRRKTLMLCMVGLLFSFGLMGVSMASGLVSLLLLGRLCAGLMCGATAIGQASIIDLSTEDTKTQNLSRITLANVSAHFLGPGMGAALAGFGLYWPFVAISALALGSMIWIYLRLEETVTTRAQEPVDWLLPVRTFRAAFNNRNIRRLSLCHIQFHTGNCMVYQFFYIYLASHYHYSPVELGLFSAVCAGSGGMIAILWLLPWLQKRYTPRILTIASLFCSAIFSVLFALDFSIAAHWIIALLWSMAIVVAYVSTLALFSDCADSESQGWAMGIASSLFAFSFILGGLSASLLTLLGVNNLIILGGAFLAGSALTLKLYVPEKLCPQPDSGQLT